MSPTVAFVTDCCVCQQQDIANSMRLNSVFEFLCCREASADEIDEMQSAKQAKSGAEKEIGKTNGQTQHPKSAS